MRDKNNALAIRRVMAIFQLIYGIVLIFIIVISHMRNPVVYIEKNILFLVGVFLIFFIYSHILSSVVGRHLDNLDKCGDEIKMGYFYRFITRLDRMFNGRRGPWNPNWK